MTGSKPPSLRGITRRHFFEQSAFGIGGLALASLMDDVVLAGGQAQPRGNAPDGARAICPEGEAGHLSLHGRRALADRPLRSQADAHEARRAGHPRRARQGRALRLHQGQAEAAGVAVPVQVARPVRGADLGAPPEPRQGRRRPHDHPLDADHAVQPRPGADLHEHRPSGHRPAEPGIVAQLRAGQREQRPARLRRAALGREQPRRRQVVLGQRLSPDRAPGGRVPIERRARALRLEPGRRRLPTCAIDRSPRSTT